MRGRPVWLMSVLFGLSLVATSAVWADEKPVVPHQTLQGTVVEKAGSLAVRVPNGTTYQLNENRALRHGHAMPKIGDEVTVVIDENNMVLEVHPQDTKGAHRFVTGEIVSMGILQHEIRLKTPEGEKTFPLENQEMTSSIKDGALVRAEVNEAGSIIDLHPVK